MLRNILFYIKEAFLSTKKNGIMSLATMISLTATMIIVGMILLAYFNINLFIQNMESQLMAVVYLEDNLSEEEINHLVNNIGELEGVKEAIYISKEEAFEKLQEDLSEHKEILAGITENPLPSSIEILVTKAEFLDEIAFQLKQYNGIEEVNYGGQLTDRLILLFDFISNTGFAIILILVFIATLIMVSVIKISVHSRQKEIEIMALVGATSWFIRWPFIIEGFFKGLISSFLAIVILIRGYFYFVERFTRIVPFLPVMSDRLELMKLGIIIILLGSFIGIFGSMISLRKINYEEI